MAKLHLRYVQDLCQLSARYGPAIPVCYIWDYLDISRVQTNISVIPAGQTTNRQTNQIASLTYGLSSFVQCFDPGKTGVRQ